MHNAAHTMLYTEAPEAHQPQIHTAQVIPVKIILLVLLFLFIISNLRLQADTIFIACTTQVIYWYIHSPWNPAYIEVHRATHPCHHHQYIAAYKKAHGTSHQPKVHIYSPGNTIQDYVISINVAYY